MALAFDLLLTLVLQSLCFRAACAAGKFPALSGASEEEQETLAGFVGPRTLFVSVGLRFAAEDMEPQSW